MKWPNTGEWLPLIKRLVRGIWPKWTEVENKVEKYSQGTFTREEIDMPNNIPECVNPELGIDNFNLADYDYIVIWNENSTIFSLIPELRDQFSQHWGNHKIKFIKFNNCDYRDWSIIPGNYSITNFPPSWLGGFRLACWVHDNIEFNDLSKVFFFWLSNSQVHGFYRWLKSLDDLLPRPNLSEDDYERLKLKIAPLYSGNLKVNEFMHIVRINWGNIADGVRLYYMCLESNKSEFLSYTTSTYWIWLNLKYEWNLELYDKPVTKESIWKFSISFQPAFISYINWNDLTWLERELKKRLLEKLEHFNSETNFDVWRKSFFKIIEDVIWEFLLMIPEDKREQCSYEFKNNHLVLLSLEKIFKDINMFLYLQKNKWDQLDKLLESFSTLKKDEQNSTLWILFNDFSFHRRLVPVLNLYANNPNNKILANYMDRLNTIMDQWAKNDIWDENYVGIMRLIKQAYLSQKARSNPVIQKLIQFAKDFFKDNPGLI